MFRFRSIPINVERADSDNPTIAEMRAKLPTQLTVWPMGLSHLADGGVDIIDERAIDLMAASWEKRGHSKIGFDCNHAAFFGMTPEQAGNHALGDVVFDKECGVVVENIEYTSDEIVEAIYSKRLRFWSPSFTPEVLESGELVTVEVEVDGVTVQALRPASLKNVAFTDVPMTNSQPPLMESLRLTLLKELRSSIVSDMADNNETVVTEKCDDKRAEEMPEVAEEVASDAEALKEQVADLEAQLAEKDEMVKELEAKLAEYEAKEVEAEMETLLESIGASDKQATYWRSQGLDALRGFAETVDAVPARDENVAVENVDEEKVEKVVAKRSLRGNVKIDAKTPVQAAALRTIEAHRAKNEKLRARTAGGNN